MKKLIYFSLSILLLIFGSCKDFEAININPNNPDIVPPEMLLPPILSGAVSTMTASGGSRAGQFVQHIAYLGGTSEEDGRYNLTGASFREEWNGAMRLIKDVNQLRLLAQENQLPHYEAVALICKVYILSIMSDAYGDIPYDEAGKGDVAGLEFPHYQSQQEVYGLMLNDLEQANQLLKGIDPSLTINRDILYNGNTGAWRKFANSLKIRILMRQSQKADVAAAVSAIFNNPSEYPIFEKVEDQATLVYNNNADLYRWFILNPPGDGSGVNFDGNDRVSETMVDMLQKVADPRMKIYVAPTKNSYNAHRSNSTVPYVYRGQRVGLSSLEQNALYQQTGLNKDDYSVLGKRIRKENRAFLFTYSELLFLKAEAIVRNMGVQGDAAAVYLEGIAASLAKWPQVGQASNEETPYISQAETTGFLRRTDIALREETALQQIAEQQWIDAFLNGYEAWASWRRTGYPQLKPGPSVLAPIPVRYVYSDNEQNNPNLIQWVNDTMGGNMPTHNTKVWFQP
ncbi:SusD/RagB family nutrient-binding outer membrane lipoprotein [Olivibacter sp. LS-1]|uniref:SusD/RagB family nutrient-binding outer membrane lipoprotein n=1 Tax=unclassified Olivibacter TaxID=2632301 RepID=UPI0011EB9512|nr:MULTISPECIES: SusD/RagB family nutrient-binding outer membrane lipoprotein [unclassified Olivibacter]MDM8177901.1 SusD/RagB family nutrient-binding outer membrane lipoprotein [Olivibacter sp. 47]QEK99586.1 SusD/RagB family nutrient-binding outer membrane lipoprotein [Olivibacter sp. LS-1]